MQRFQSLPVGRRRLLFVYILVYFPGAGHGKRRRRIRPIVGMAEWIDGYLLVQVPVQVIQGFTLQIPGDTG